MQVFLAMMKQPMPAAAVAASAREKDRNPWWMLRKWLLRVAFRLLDRYGDPKIVKIETARNFASLFLSEFSIPFLDVRSRTPGCAHACMHRRSRHTHARNADTASARAVRAAVRAGHRAGRVFVAAGDLVHAAVPAGGREAERAAGAPAAVPVRHAGAHRAAAHVLQVPAPLSPH